MKHLKLITEYNNLFKEIDSEIVINNSIGNDLGFIEINHNMLNRVNIISRKYFNEEFEYLSYEEEKKLTIMCLVENHSICLSVNNDNYFYILYDKSNEDDFVSTYESYICDDFDGLKQFFKYLKKSK